MNKEKYTINILNKHYHDLKGTIINIFIGRGSIYGNPYTHLNDEKTLAEFKVETREIAIKKYSEYFINKFKNDEDFRFEIFNLAELINNQKEVNFVCYCAPKQCHGDFLRLFILKVLKEKYT